MHKKAMVLIAALLAPITSHSQDTRATFERIPQIAVAAQDEIKIAPDRATIQISVQTRAATAAAAGSQNATRTQAVLSALRALGLTNDQLSTTGYNVSPEFRHREGRDPEVLGYAVTNTVLADVRQLTQVGAVIDAALGAGANMMTSLQFYASNPEPARRTAIAGAIAKARADAEAAARAAGGTLGELLEINIGAYFPRPPQPMLRLAAGIEAASTPIQPGQQTLSVTVNTRWRFNQTR
jgi:uncharacterized protein YggE